MQEPQASNLPFAYDDSSTLFGALVNHKTFTVKYQVDVETLQVVIYEDAGMMNAPLYITFEGGEIWLVDDISQNADEEWVFSVESHFNQRAMHGSPLQPHVDGEKIFIGLLSQHIIMAKRVLQASQQYRFLAGADAQRLAITPQLGERFLCIDTKCIYYCLVAGTWTWMNRTHHADMDGLADNDHPQYALVADLAGWHGTSGHMIGGDEHDHTTTNEGVAAERIRNTTWGSIGAPVCECDLAFVTDVDGGTLYVAFDGITWEKLSGIPSGAIAMFNTTCPAGWSRYAALDGRFPMSSTAVGTVGGSSSHTHTYTDMPAHAHSIGSVSVSSDSKGSHTHTVTAKSSGGGGSTVIAKTYGNTTTSTTSGGNHSHTVSVGARTTNSTGGVAATDAGSSLPPYQEVIFCKKA